MMLLFNERILRLEGAPPSNLLPAGAAADVSSQPPSSQSRLKPAAYTTPPSSQVCNPLSNASRALVWLTDGVHVVNDDAGRVAGHVARRRQSSGGGGGHGSRERNGRWRQQQRERPRQQPQGAAAQAEAMRWGSKLSGEKWHV